MESKFCVIPWIQYSTKPNGNVRICCLMSNSDDPDRGVLRRQNQTIINAKDADSFDLYNSEKVKQLRKDMLSGKENSLCNTCWQKEKIGLKSKRLVSNKAFQDAIDEKSARTITAENGEISKYRPMYLDLRFGNKCNLKCIMCHPASSSSWYDDYVEISGKDYFYDTGERVYLKNNGESWRLKNTESFNWYESKSFWDQLESRLSDVRQIYLVGGEPLLIKQHNSFLRKCVEGRYANNITLEYDTNMSFIDDELVDLWSSFKKVLLRVSVESVGDKNNYIRFPSKWSVIKKNIDYLEKNMSNIVFDFSITWQVYNLFSITNIWDIYPSKGSVRILSHPEHLDIKILPRELKEKAIKHLLDFGVDKHHQIPSMIKYLEDNLEIVSEEKLKIFNQYTATCDRLRDLSFKKTFPELKTIL